MKMVDRLQSELNARVKVSEVYSNSTLYQLANLISCKLEKVKTLDEAVLEEGEI